MNNAHVSHQTELPIERGLYKDHKEGRAMRPLVNGNIGPADGLNNIASDILEPFVEELRIKHEGKNTCKSTEEAISIFENYNKRIDKGDIVGKKFIASMDVKSLFPSLKTVQCVNAVKKTIISSKIMLKGFNHKELGIFLRKFLTTEDIESKQLNHLFLSKTKERKMKRKRNEII